MSPGWSVHAESRSSTLHCAPMGPRACLSFPEDLGEGQDSSLDGNRAEAWRYQRSQESGRWGARDPRLPKAGSLTSESGSLQEFPKVAANAASPPPGSKKSSGEGRGAGAASEASGLLFPPTPATWPRPTYPQAGHCRPHRGLESAPGAHGPRKWRSKWTCPAALRRPGRLPAPASRLATAGSALGRGRSHTRRPSHHGIGAQGREKRILTGLEKPALYSL